MRIRQEYLYIGLIGLGLVILLRNLGLAFSILWPIGVIVAGIMLINPASIALNTIVGIGATILSLAILVSVLLGVAGPVLLLLLVIMAPILLVVFGVTVISVILPFLVIASPLILIVLVLAAIF